MKKLILLVFLLFSVSSFYLSAQQQEIPVPFTLADRDRMVRLEDQVKENSKKIDRLEDEFDSYFMWGFGLVLMSIFGLIGFIIYDRRTTLAPVENKTEKIIKALRETAEKDSNLGDALKKSSLW